MYDVVLLIHRRIRRRRCSGGRKLITSLVSSQILYAALMWAEEMNVRAYARVGADYRQCALRTFCAFRTVSADAAVVIAGLIPLRELVRSWPIRLKRHHDVVG